MKTTVNLSLIYELLAAALYDVEEGNPADAVPALEECLQNLAVAGIVP